MAGREGTLFKFFQKWKEKKLNKLANDMIKDNPSLEKNLKDMDKSFGKFEKELKKRKDNLTPAQKRILKQRHG
tara:strand:- start:251 stop:469 length:219 start_codon:yes stop_codon:yes gene_type:complete